MRKTMTGTALLLVYTLILWLPSEAIAKEDIQKIISDISAKIYSIDTYHARLDTRIYPSCVSIKDLNHKYGKDRSDSVRSDTVVIGESDKKMKITTVIHTSESDIKIKYGLIYDGVWLWIEQHTVNRSKNDNSQHDISAMKISIAEVSPNPEKEPFNTFFLVKGNGLWPYKDLPGTFKEILNSYDFNKIGRLEKSGEIIITGVHKDKLADNSNKNENDGSDIDDNEMFCHLKIVEDNFLITSISYGRTENAICMNTDIEYVNINNKLPKNIFSYQAQQGVVVRDITSYIIDKKEKMKKRK